MSNLLLLGEGDFSFSRDLCQIMGYDEVSSDLAIVVTTSFDDRNELQKKYSNIESTLSNLESCRNVQIIHGIDATKNIKSQLKDRCCKTLSFDYVVFNFPHLGYEDLKAHSSLIAHILHRAHEILSDGSLHGSFYLTLAQSQAENWNLKEMALRNGMFCFDEVPFVQQLWPSYQLKRHHTGKSFGSRVINCIHYCLRKQNCAPQAVKELSALTDIPASGANLFREVHKRLLEQKGSSPSTESDHLDAQLNTVQESSNVLINDTTIKNFSNAKKIPRKKRKVDNMVEGGYMKVLTSSSPQISVPGGMAPTHFDMSTSTQEENWQCKSCERCFQSEQGVKTHVYMMHVLDGGDVVDNNCLSGNIPLICSLCTRACSNNDALQQHTIAKHSGQYQDIKPSWAMEAVSERRTSSAENDPTSPSVSDSSSYDCMICLFTFPTPQQLDNHLLGWQPLNVTDRLSCEHCQSSFKDDRALKQHTNYCRAVSMLRLPECSVIEV